MPLSASWGDGHSNGTDVSMQLNVDDMRREALDLFAREVRVVFLAFDVPFIDCTGSQAQATRSASEVSKKSRWAGGIVAKGSKNFGGSRCSQSSPGWSNYLYSSDFLLIFLNSS
jgi:hypothetical protein